MPSNQRNHAFTDESAVAFGRHLQRWRSTEGLTQGDLGRIAGLTQGQISRILDGGARELTPAVRRLAKAAGVDLADVQAASAMTALRARLHAELDLSWDGSAAQANALVSLLRAARSLSAAHGSAS